MAIEKAGENAKIYAKVYIMRRLLVRSHEILLKLHRGTLLAGVLLLIALFGYLDYLTGFEITFSFFYLIPIAIAVWYIDGQVGLGVIILSLAIWLVSNWLAGETYTYEIIRYLNVLTRLLFFMLGGLLLSELKQALSQERSLSRTDYLTGICNSREFYTRANLEIERARRYKYPFSLAYIDLDDFKQINDNLGHSEGDRLLRLFAQTTSDIIRKTDMFARLGGDEFAILFPNTDQEGARCAVEKLEETIDARMKHLPRPVTMSIGVITFKNAPGSVDGMLQKADDMLYKAKRAGKSRSLFTQLD
jgi:diguanylate cyclase (GGDEF)-like protein